jgi:uncharacterized protein (DUF362 family)
MTVCSEVQFTAYDKSVAEVLNALNASDILSKQKFILIKPNLINASLPPITTPVACCEAIVQYIRGCAPGATIVIAEGCGPPNLETFEVFETLGYSKLSQSMDIELIDLNHALLCKRENPQAMVFKEMYLPKVLFTHYVISVPMLKAHSIATITGALKNMVGCLPPQYYSRKGHWKKAATHDDMHASIIDINHYRKPDLSIMDASIGLCEYHLGGAHCNPPVGKMLASFDPLALDRRAAELLDLDWREIGHLEEGVEY